MTTARCFPIAVVLLIPLLLCSQNLNAAVSSPAREGVPVLTAAAQQKVGSGRLLEQVSRKYSHVRALGKSAPPASIVTAVYASEPPSPSFLAELEARGARAYPDSWIPPSHNHPLGIFFVQLPIDKIADVLALDRVKKMDTAESESVPMNNQSARLIKADVAWSHGWTGSGVKVGVIDSGLDLVYEGNELPAGISVRDYSNYPRWTDNTVNNTITGHGTHVTGTILGRGTHSAANTANGGGAYKGMAPDASLVFLKIGLDYLNGATDMAQYGAIHAAVDEFQVRVINLSYGGWDAYHDGTSVAALAIDYAYDHGVACFVAAGNLGSAAWHAQGFAPPAGLSDFIEVTVANPGATTLMKFNLVWSDGKGVHNNLSLLYYDGAKQPLSNVTNWLTTESDRGTESQFSQCDPIVPLPAGTYYVRVANPSAMTQEFHLYEALHSEDGSCRITFAHPDPNYTITTPGDADHAFTVGAYTSRVEWKAVDGSMNPCAGADQSIASYSGRGPRVDGAFKPDIVAPGCVIISLRDHDANSSTTNFCVADDGSVGGVSNYFVMEGTSMASPVCAGAAALLYQYIPAATPQQIYDALTGSAIQDLYTPGHPTPVWGYGKLNVNQAILDAALPVELTSFTSSVRGEAIALAWHTAGETNNYGFEIEKMDADGSAPGTPPSAQTSWVKIGFVPGSGTSNVPQEYGFVDKASHSGTVAYRLKQIDRDGKFAYSAVVEATPTVAPAVYSLSQNYPNPFNPSTTIRYTVAAAARVRLAVYDLLGREMAVLTDRQMQPGTYSVDWNAAAVPSGVYFYRLDAGTYHDTKKLLLQK